MHLTSSYGSTARLAGSMVILAQPRLRDWRVVLLSGVLMLGSLASMIIIQVIMMLGMMSIFPR